ncbi:hypothetical protein T07_8679, partial [Trichinella nelsoni]
LISSSIMPVFHTKTIESILEPVAQQLVLLVGFVSNGSTTAGRAFRHVFFGIQTCRKLADAHKL